MAFICTLRGPARGRQTSFVPGSLACAAVRPLALSASIQWAEPPATVNHTDSGHSTANEAPASSLTRERP